MQTLDPRKQVAPLTLRARTAAEMMTPNPVSSGQAGIGPIPSHDLSGAVVELAMFLTFDEAAALESAAGAKGMTVARLLRAVIQDSLARWMK